MEAVDTLVLLIDRRLARRSHIHWGWRLLNKYLRRGSRLNKYLRLWGRLVNIDDWLRGGSDCPRSDHASRRLVISDYHNSESNNEAKNCKNNKRTGNILSSHFNFDLV